MYQFISRILFTALVLSLAACGGGGGSSTTTPPANQLPVISEGTSTSVSMSVNSTPTAFNLTLNATDADGDTLTWSVGTLASHGTASVSGTGTSKAVGYTPNKDYAGADSFVVQVSDGKGGTASITVNVMVNDDANPVIQQSSPAPVTMSVNGTPTAFNLTLNASDANNETLTWSVSTQASNGTASVSGTGTSKAVSYSPSKDFAGSDSFVVQVSDANGRTATITVNVTVVDDASPVIAEGSSTSVTMSVNSTPVAFNLTLHASDANNETLTWSLGTAVTAQNGTASVSGTGTSMAVSYTTTSTTFVGSDSFDVQVSDTHGLTATITVNVTISNNTAALIVDAGPSSISSTNPAYNRPYVSVTICDQSTPANCQTIDHIVVDTGAVGLRVLSSALTLTTLPTYNDTTSSKPIGECYPLVGGYLWGTLRKATVQIGGEATSSTIPIQVVGDTVAGLAPSGANQCTSVGTDMGTVTAINANGILGVGYFKSDCGTACTVSNNVYYTCTSPTDSTSCSSIVVTAANQVPNPVSQFALDGMGVSDNNGVIITLPPVSQTGGTDVTGTLTFGVNTQTDNQLANTATIMTVDTATGFLSTQFNGVNLCNSIIDSGSNNLNFPQGTNTPPLCSGTIFYCPATTTTFTATITGLNGTSAPSTTFYVTDPYPLVGTAFNDIAAALDTVALTYPSGCPGSSPTGGSFIWGLPFFFGKTVAVVIEGNTVQNINITGPFIAF